MGDEEKNPLEIVADTVETIITGLPAPVRKNATTAFTRLCTAIVDYPVAVIESKTAERRAESEARVKLIGEASRQITDQLRVDPEYARAAAGKFAHKIVREQLNLDKISLGAADLLNKENTDLETVSGHSHEPSVEISEDWLNIFEEKAAKVSSAEMQAYFSKILAGEIRKPSSYSIKTVQMMAELDNKVAGLFRRLCSMSISIRDSGNIIDARVIGLGNPSMNSLRAFGLGYTDLNLLAEHGLIINDYNSWMDYISSVPKTAVRPCYFDNHEVVFVEMNDGNLRNELKLSGVTFSSSGKELLGVIHTEPVESYRIAVLEYFQKLNLIVKRVKRDGTKIVII